LAVGGNIAMLDIDERVIKPPDYDIDINIISITVTDITKL